MFGLLRILFRGKQPERQQVQGLIAQSIERIALFLKEWPDQKIYDVYAFCQDGRMHHNNPCCCLLGVFGSARLHQWCTDTDKRGVPVHYSVLKKIPAMAEIERAYLILGLEDDLGSEVDQRLMDFRLLDLLGREMRAAGARHAYGFRN